MMKTQSGSGSQHISPKSPPEGVSAHSSDSPQAATRDEVSLPVRRAFVVQLHAHAQAQADTLSGRAEHIVSGQASHFRSTTELMAFIERVLQQENSQEL